MPEIYFATVNPELQLPTPFEWEKRRLRNMFPANSSAGAYAV